MNIGLLWVWMNIIGGKSKMSWKGKRENALFGVVITIKDKTFIVSEHGEVRNVFLDKDKAFKEAGIIYKDNFYVSDIVHNGVHFYIPSKEILLFNADNLELLFVYNKEE